MRCGREIQREVFIKFVKKKVNIVFFVRQGVDILRLKKRNLVFAFGNIVKMQQMRQQLVTMVMIATVLILAFILYYFHWKYELPQHPNIDETITLNNIEKLLSGKWLQVLTIRTCHIIMDILCIELQVTL